MTKLLNTTKSIITNLDLYSFKFPIDVLESNIDSLDLKTLIKTQDLTYDFIIKYVLNEEYQITPEEKTIDIYDVIYNQPHIDINELKKRLKFQQ
jgi:hypothetical protein